MPGMLWLLLAVGMLTIILIGLQMALQKSGLEKKVKQKIFTRTTAVSLIWLVLLSVLSLNGFFSDFDKLPPRPLFAIIIPLPFVFAFAFSKTGTQLLCVIPKHWLIFIQSFRVIVELLLWSAFIHNTMPVQMTFEGRNFDVLTGILALPVGYLLMKKNYSTRFAIAFNIIGIILLINVLTIAVLSMPTPLRYFMNEPSNALVVRFPFILLPGVMVPIAYSMHIFSLRQLLKEKNIAAYAMSWKR